jgi:hypothetical protein
LVRSIRWTKPSFLLQPGRSDKALIYLFDEPQFNTQDGYIGFMLDFFRRLRDEGRVVFVCLHPNEPYHIELMREICERFVAETLREIDASFLGHNDLVLVLDSFVRTAGDPQGVRIDPIPFAAARSMRVKGIDRDIVVHRIACSG